MTPNEKYKTPNVEKSYYWKEYVLLLSALFTPFIALALFGCGELFARFGSITVFLCALVEFSLIGKANQKHLNNVARTYDPDEEQRVVVIFSSEDRLLSYFALVLGLLGTIIWGFGDLISR